MPGYEVVGKEELAEITDIFERAGGVFFRMGFDARRNGVFKVREFEGAFAASVGTNHALAVTSGTAALKVALEALGVRPGDEVITQSFTFVATVEAIIEARATPVVTQIDETLNMCPRSLEASITPRSKAIIVVHMLGVPCDLDAILPIARARGIPVIEDTAWGVGGAYKGRALGSIADAGTYSFDNAKAMTTGEGGMIVTNHAALDARARAYHDHGHDNNPAVPRWVDTRSSSGFNYRMTELQGAVGLAQLRKLPDVIAQQRRLHAAIRETLAVVPGIRERSVPAGSEPSCDAYVFDAGDSATALRCREEVLAVGLGTKILPEAVTWHFAGTWNHMPELVAAHGGKLAEHVAPSAALLARHVALPINLGFDPATLSRIGEAVRRAVAK